MAAVPSAFTSWSDLPSLEPLVSGEGVGPGPLPSAPPPRLATGAVGPRRGTVGAGLRSWTALAEPTRALTGSGGPSLELLDELGSLPSIEATTPSTPVGPVERLSRPAPVVFEETAPAARPDDSVPSVPPPGWWPPPRPRRRSTHR